LLPSPQGVLRQVMRRVLVGIRMGPFTLGNFVSLALRIKSLHTDNDKYTHENNQKHHMYSTIKNITCICTLQWL
jgi:hypothetical protein